MAQSLFKGLAGRSPRPCIQVLAPGWTRPLLSRMPEVEDAIDMPLGRQLARRGFDQAIVLPNSLKSALIPWWAGIPRRTGRRGEWRYGLLNDLRKLDKQALPMTVQRFVALGLPPGHDPEPVPVPRLVADPEQAEQALRELGLTQTPGRSEVRPACFEALTPQRVWDSLLARMQS